MSELFLRTVNLSISASWLILAVLLLRLTLKRAPKWVNVLLWGIVAFRLLCPFSIESALSLIPSAETIPLNIGMDTTPAIHSGLSSIDAAVNPGLIGSNTPIAGASVNPLQITIGIYESIWSLGMAAMVLYTTISYLHLRSKVATAVLLRENIFQSENVESPFVLGLIRPRIYLPFSQNGTELDHVLAHEQTHIRRKDHWWKPIGFLLLIIHWFNPLMWLAYILLCRDIELACDEKVIKELGSEQRADYSQALLNCSVNRRMIAACPLAFGEVGVKERVKNVMNYKKPTFWIVLIAVVVCIVVAVCFLTDPIGEETENAVLEATILEIHDNAFLVRPVVGSPELNSADMIYVPMENMEPSPEPEVGDIIRIEYDGMLMETYPAQIGNVFHIEVIAELTLQSDKEQLENELNDLEEEYRDTQSGVRLINLNGILYTDTGEAIPAEIDPSAVAGTLHTQVEGRPANHGQGNFDCVGCQYAWVNGNIAVLIDHEWYLFTEEVLTSPEYYLTIGGEDAVSIEIRTGSRVQLVCKDDMSAYKRGESVLLPVLTGKEHLRGVTITVRDKDNHDIFTVSISAKEHGTADGVIECGDWVITPVQSEKEKP